MAARIHQLDFLRGLAAVGVIAIHTVARGIAFSEKRDVYVVVDAAFRNCLPFFLFAAGAALAYARGDCSGRFYSFLGRRLRYIGIPYLLWSLPRFFAHGICEPRRVVLGLLTGRYLFFVVLIFQFYLLFPLFARCCRRIPRTVLAVALATHLLLLALWCYADALFDWDLPDLHTYINPAFWFSYFIAGMVVGADIPSFQTRINAIRPSYLVALFLVAAMGSIYEQHALFGSTGRIFNYMRPGNLAYSLIGILCWWRLWDLLKVPGVRRMMTLLGRHSYGIYVSHYAILYALYYVVAHRFYGTGIGELLTFLGGISLSLLFCVALSRTQIGVLVIGKTGGPYYGIGKCGCPGAGGRR